MAKVPDKDKALRTMSEGTVKSLNATLKLAKQGAKKRTTPQ